MANLKDIRRRIKSVNNTAQITKAMQMVAAAKMKKAQDLLKKVRAEVTGDAEYSTVGKKLREQLVKANDTLVESFTLEDPIPFEEVKPIAKHLTEQYLSGTYNKVSVCFTNFVSTLVQEPHVSQLLPIDPSKLAEKRDYEGVGKGEVDQHVWSR